MPKLRIPKRKKQSTSERAEKAVEERSEQFIREFEDGLQRVDEVIEEIKNGHRETEPKKAAGV